VCVCVCVRACVRVCVCVCVCVRVCARVCNKFITSSMSDLFHNRTKISAARVSYAADVAHRPPLHGYAAAACELPSGERLKILNRTDLRTDERTDTAPF